MAQDKSIDLPVADEKDLDDSGVVFQPQDPTPTKTRTTKRVKFGALKRKTEVAINSSNLQL